MLPSLLGTNLCSLRSNVDRLSFSCIWEITPDAKILSANFTKSVIRSKASLTYDEAQARLDDPKATDAVSLGIKTLNMLAKKLRKKRMEAGALTLASPEVRFRMENDSQDPVDVEMKELKDTNALVEEFMLLANIQVAKKIQSVFPDSSMLRRHPQPPMTNFEGLMGAVSQLGFNINPSTSKTLSDSLDACTTEDPYFNKLVRIMTTRCMMQAVFLTNDRYTFAAELCHRRITGITV
jgi:exosome complex exonuclease DIS3/RRP44